MRPLFAPAWAGSVLLPALVLGLAVPAVATDLTVVVEGIDPAQGPLMLALADRAESFDALPDHPDQAAVALRMAPGGERVTLSLSGLPDGRYAAAAYQDRNRDGRLATGFLGLPAEPYGFSAEAMLGRPGFDAAAAGGGTLRLRLRR